MESSSTTTAAAAAAAATTTTTTTPSSDTNKKDTNTTTTSSTKNYNVNTNKGIENVTEPEAAAVLAFLRKRGLGSAALELQKHLDSSSSTTSTNCTSATISSNKKAKQTPKDDKNENDDDKEIETMDIDKDENKKEIERIVEEIHENKSVLNLATGGGIGYDLDTAADILIWGQGTTHQGSKVHIRDNKSSSDKEAADENDHHGDYDDNHNKQDNKEALSQKERWLQSEGKRYVRAFTALQTWVLTLPNDDHGNYNHATIQSVLHHAKVHAGLVDSDVASSSGAESTSACSPTKGNNDDIDDDSPNKDDNNTDEQTKNNNKLQSETTTHVIPANNESSFQSNDRGLTKQKQRPFQASLIPKSIKPELLSLCFPLLVHTYCQLLESGLESTAHALLSTYRHIHEPHHPEQFLDLDKCKTQAEMKRLTSLIKGYTESISKAKTLKKKRDKLNSELKLIISLSNNTSGSGSSSNNNNNSTPDHQHIIGNIKILENKYKEIATIYSDCEKKLKVYPFLKRARSVKWHIHLSSLTFQMLVRFFHSGNDGGVELLPMSGIVQSHCHLIVQNRDPVPFVPGCILEDMIIMDGTSTSDIDIDNNEGHVNVIQNDDKGDDNNGIKWAAPMEVTSRLLADGEDIDNVNSILKSSQRLPFPEYYLKSEYATLDEYQKDKRKVEFNRAILTNGFRRLEALEAKREYDVGIRVKDGSNNKNMDSQILFGNPMEPSIMFSTICASSSKVTNTKHGSGLQQQQCRLNKSSIDLTCAKLCLPDGRHVAAGCSDSAIRIWAMQSWNTYSGKSTVDHADCVLAPRESAIVLHGHKKGLPVYAVNWNRDGRTLLSAGGDGTIRLWDSGAVGPFGKLASVTKLSSKITSTAKRYNKNITGEPTTHIPGAKSQSMVEKHGAALACYKGHAKSTPVWSVAMAPCGYYFASAGSDSTARLWCTDRPTPVRIFLGHHSQNVNCLTWHPNCNYLLSGSDDKTVRMWDVQSGHCVRILSGCKFGVNQVKVSPSGQYVAASDYGGKLSIWDIRNGMKLKEFQHDSHGGRSPPTIHSLSYSPCGSTIASGGDDCVIRIWDARGVGNIKSNADYAASLGWGSGSNILANASASDQSSEDTNNDPLKTFYTSNSMILDLEFTKRNLLLSVGKYDPL